MLQIVGDKITLSKGDTGTIEVAVTEQDGETVWDLTSYTIHFLVALNWSVTYANMSIKIDTGGGGVVLTDAANGLYEIRLTPTETDVIAVADYVWATKGISVGGAVYTFASGLFRLDHDLPHETP